MPPIITASHRKKNPLELSQPVSGRCLHAEGK
jgi:hypothetical protein